jgi:acetyl-CoA C-acetyltransferase
VLVGNLEAGVRLGLKPRARIVSFAAIGSEPTLMLDGPSHAARKALARAGMQVSDIDLWELNEAFASVVLTMMEELDIPHERMNVNGGAIAMGHPLGATGAMILGTVLDELERTGKKTALVSLCVAAGMGSAMVIERI